jgi:hypothetical protein
MFSDKKLVKKNWHFTHAPSGPAYPTITKFGIAGVLPNTINGAKFDDYQLTFLGISN